MSAATSHPSLSCSSPSSVVKILAFLATSQAAPASRAVTRLFLKMMNVMNGDKAGWSERISETLEFRDSAGRVHVGWIGIRAMLIQAIGAPAFSAA